MKRRAMYAEALGNFPQAFTETCADQRRLQSRPALSGWAGRIEKPSRRDEPLSPQ
jgi:hypothetical protein